MEQRKTRRFRMALPLEITHCEGKRVSRAVKTCNVGSGGVLFSSGREMAQGGSVEYLTTLVNSQPSLRLRCRGTVLRVTRLATEIPEFEIALSIDRYEFIRPASVHSDSAEKADQPRLSIAPGLILHSS